MPALSVTEAHDLIRSALIGSGTSAGNAAYFAQAILDTELSGLDGHGFYWLQFYCRHLRSGKVDGKAVPRVEAVSEVGFRVDAGHGFAHPAIEAGFRRLIPAAKAHGVAAMGVYNSYNAATLGYHTGVLARAGLLGIGATNAVPTVAPVGGRVPVIGTNPISYAVPAPGGEIAFLVDQSATAVAWTAVKRAADAGEPIPPGWALDRNGEPTTDAEAGLAGSMAPAGGVKGFSIGLLVEVLCAALAGGRLGPDQGSFTEDDGRPIDNGQFFLALDPDAFSRGGFAPAVTALTASIMAQDGARLPNARREASRERLAREGLTIDADLLARLRAFA
ncbi:Ldh family oxidoreductase [Labrys wisconsinensis]|uniref:(2R)-3-sulfolactate dehydrogenase (NADP+) n=1 Tax=Labrys wisconsinensis TaxID=425677 RepID=A0ABU0JFN1_9HYPH|nr:Ldh family oxidoreductase [Labrys wisconsinensis]MDQ0473095.1 (2R)-3-sulfolactate dehydrogenase (NADP+) [Labrys wisconsinensis]